MMAANGGGPPTIKKEEQFDSKQILMLENHHHLEINKNKSISIAERRAAKCGFNASNINGARFRPNGPSAPQLRTPYLTIPPGISPSALLDSPIMLPNAQAQLSPTTGTFQFPSPNHESLKLKLKLASNGDSTINAMESSSKPEAHHQGVPHHQSALRVENMPFNELEYPRENLQLEMTKRECDTLAKSTQVLGNKSREDAECMSTLQPPPQPQPSNTANQTLFIHNGQERSTHPNQEKHHQKGAHIPKEGAKYSEDGFFWRKYGQKHVKGSEFPRSYYKCTNTNCMVRKKVERSHDGQITEIVYKGSHNHPKPQPFNKRFSDHEITNNEGSGSGTVKPEVGAANTAKDVPFSSDWRRDGLDNGPSSTPLFLTDFSSDPLTIRSMSTFDHQPAVETQDFSSTFGSQDGDDQNGASPESVSFNEEDDENGECEPKKRKRENIPNENIVPRSTREPKVVVQIESEIDILDDGYRWRKYGQKVVKGNPNPRSYYKCTTPGCPVRKHVERAADDIKSVITTYEGKHNHQVPCSKTGGVMISDVAKLPQKHDDANPQKHDDAAVGKQQVQHLPLYLDRKPILNYNELMMRSNLPGNFPSDLNFRASSVYPLSFPPFHSLPNYSSLLMNNSNHMNTGCYPSSKLYPTLPDYNISLLPSQITTHHHHHHHLVPPNNVPTLAANFHYNNNNNYQAALQTSDPSAGQEIRDCHAKILKPKQEQRDEVDVLYHDNCLSIPNHGNGTI